MLLLLMMWSNKVMRTGCHERRPAVKGFKLYKYRVVFFTGTPQFQYQKENPPSNQSWPFLVKRFIRTAALIGWLAVFFLVLKSGGTSEKKTTLYVSPIIILIFSLKKKHKVTCKVKSMSFSANDIVSFKFHFF